MVRARCGRGGRVRRGAKQLRRYVTRVVPRSATPRRLLARLDLRRLTRPDAPPRGPGRLVVVESGRGSRAGKTG